MVPILLFQMKQQKPDATVDLAVFWRWLFVSSPLQLLHTVELHGPSFVWKRLL